MKKIKWKVSLDGRLVDCGTELGESDREVLDRILKREVGEFEVVDDRSYSIQVGELMMSSYGDEFQRTSNMLGPGVDEKDVPGGYLFPSSQSVKAKDKFEVTVKVDPESLEVIQKSAQRFKESLRRLYPSQVDWALGAVDPWEELVKAAHSPERAEEIISRVRDQARTTPMSYREAQRAYDLLASGQPCAPSDHVLRSVSVPEMRAQKYFCVDCGRTYAVYDEARGNIDVERMVRHRLSDPR